MRSDLLDAPSFLDRRPRPLQTARTVSARLAVIMVGGLGASPALADDLADASASDCALPNPPGDDAQARANALFARGQQLFRSGETRAACACFEASQRAVPGRGGTLLNLGLCRADLGELVPAYEALDASLRVGFRVGQQDRARIARERLRAVEAGLAWLALVWPDDRPSEGVEFQLDGVPVPRHRWGAVPVEPGEHTLVVRCEGSVPRRMALSLEAAERRTVHVAPLELRPSAQEPPAAQALPVLAPARDVAPRDTAPPMTRTSGKRRAAWSLTIVGFTVGAIAGAWAIADKRSLARHCPEGECAPKWISLADRGRALTIVSGTALGLGVVGSLYLWILSASTPRAGASQTHASRAHGAPR